MVSIKVEPDDPFVWEENSYGKLNIPDRLQTLSSEDPDSILVKSEPVPSCVEREGVKEEQTNDPFVESGDSVLVKSEPVSSCLEGEGGRAVMEEQTNDPFQEIESDDVTFQVTVDIDELLSEEADSRNAVVVKTEDTDVQGQVKYQGLDPKCGIWMYCRKLCDDEDNNKVLVQWEGYNIKTWLDACEMRSAITRRPLETQPKKDDWPTVKHPSSLQRYDGIKVVRADGTTSEKKIVYINDPYNGNVSDQNNQNKKEKQINKYINK
ncbi:hypothetical protein HOLleu_21762 [Holothuria leucospilota]|uniref:Uncharacterized protein n=1 Tax=Holothuria leucospilota TaxID=206669 RepID=A0A9Q1BXW8_HOLLE|nr:hypothetical protein HOLleu_21762 [Holothuria leucospilota]